VCKYFFLMAGALLFDEKPAKVLCKTSSEPFWDIRNCSLNIRTVNFKYTELFPHFLETRVYHRRGSIQVVFQTENERDFCVKCFRTLNSSKSLKFTFKNFKQHISVDFLTMAYPMSDTTLLPLFSCSLHSP